MDQSSFGPTLIGQLLPERPNPEFRIQMAGGCAAATCVNHISISISRILREVSACSGRGDG